jgi:hypothetical protein
VLQITQGQQWGDSKHCFGVCARHSVRRCLLFALGSRLRSRSKQETMYPSYTQVTRLLLNVKKVGLWVAGVTQATIIAVLSCLQTKR